MRFAKSLLVFITLVLTQVVSAEPEIEALRRQLDEHSAYAVTIEGRDENGEFTALYYYSPEVRVVRIKNRNGKSIFEYDRAKVDDRVQVTRNGVAYRYRLDNPLIPFGLPDSLLSRLLNEVEGPARVSDGEGGKIIVFSDQNQRDVRFVFGPNNGIDRVEFPSEHGELTVTALKFDPQKNDPNYSRLRRYIARTSEGL